MFHVIPLAADSMGTRSMATFIETNDVRLLIDPIAEIVPSRYGLEPHPVERWRLKSHQERIEIFCGSADIIVLTHFRADLVESPGNKAYRNKIFLLKNPNCLADRVQRKRAFEFIRSVRGHAQDIQYIDGRKINRNGTSVIFSDPFPFDQREKKGSYVQVSVKEGDHCFHFSSKVRGPWQDEAAEYIIQQNPDSIYLDGPGSGEEGSEDEVSMDDAVIRIKWIMEKTRLVDMILDHHLMRDAGWQEGIEPLYRLASQMGIRIQTAAEVRGEPVQALEARRKYLYETDPPRRNDIKTGCDAESI